MTGRTTKGTVIWYDTRKGYGFAKPTSGAEVFVHYSRIENELASGLEAGLDVVFEMEQTEQGPIAHNVRRPS